MPEGAEVQVVVDTLSNHILGRRLDKLIVGKPEMFKYQTPEEFEDLLTGALVTSLERRGKYILCNLYYEDGRETHVLIIHLAMTGAVIAVQDDETSHLKQSLIDGTYVEITVKDVPASELYFLFSDYRKFGSMKIVPRRWLEEKPKNLPSHMKGLLTLGVDPLRDPFVTSDFIDIIRKKKYADKPIKDVLQNQEVLAGMGNIYANEVCYATGVYPTRTVSSLSDEKLRDMYKTAHHILARSVEAGGSSIKDFVDANGVTGKSQDKVLVIYGKEKCLSGHDVEVGYVKDKVTYYCSKCQE